MIDINKLDPVLRDKIIKVKDAAYYDGINIIYVQGWRDLNYQLQLFNAGLSKAKGFDGPHTQIENGLPCSKAVDFGVIDEHGNYIKDGKDPRYGKVGMIAKSYGLVWGGDFIHTAPDWDHIELSGWRIKTGVTV